MNSRFVSTLEVEELARGPTKSLKQKSLDFQKTSGVATRLLRGVPKRSREFRRAFSYRNCSVWNLAEAALHYDVLEFLIPRIQAVDELLARERPSKIFFVKDGSMASACIEVVCRSRGIACSVKTTRESLEHAIQKTVFVPQRILTRLFHRISYSPLLSAFKRGLRKPEGAADVILLSYGSVHWATLATLYKKLVAKGISVKAINFQRHSETDSSRLLREQEISFHDFGDYLTPEAFARAREFEKKLRQSWKSLREDSRVRSALVFDTIELLPLLEPWIYYLLVFRKRFTEIALFIEGFQEIVRRHEPKLIVSVDEVSGLGRTAAQVANKLGVKSLVVQHGLMEVCPLFSPLHSTKAAVWGNFYKRELIRVAVPDSKIVVTGIPRWDEVIKKMRGREFDSEKTRQALGLVQGKKVLLWAAQKHLPAKHLVDAAIAEASRSLAARGVVLVVKPHPEEGMDYYKKLVKQAIVSQKNLHELLACSEAVVTGTSTAGLDALLFGKPLVVVNLSGERDKVRFVEEGAALGAYRKQDVLKTLEKALFDEKTKKLLFEKSRKFLRGQANGLDGLSTQRLARVVEDLLEAHKSQ